MIELWIGTNQLSLLALPVMLNIERFARRPQRLLSARGIVAIIRR
jgi:hypothetical protein